jgi:hypothetical protein
VLAPFLHRRLLLMGLGAAGAAHLTGCATPGARERPRWAPSPQPPVPVREPAADASSVHPPSPPTEPIEEAVAPIEAYEPMLDLPERPSGAETGSAFLERTEGLGRSAMDEQISDAILAGNVPDYQRRLVPIVIEAEGMPRATLHVASDYLAVGSDEDFVRMPMTSAAAQRIADRAGAILPTPKLVDEIYRQATVKLPPSWIDGGPTEGTLADYAVHNDRLEERRRRGGHPLGALTAGHKKDIVLCGLIERRPGRVAIYGWHKREGDVVQPLSTAHSCRYADYSHGARMVHAVMLLDEEERLVAEVLSDPELAWILSDEGPLGVLSYSRELPP